MPDATARPIRVLLLYLAFIFLGAALTAPWIYKFSQAIDQQISASELERHDLIKPLLQTLHKIVRQPFHRYVNRLLLFFALAGLWPFLRSLGIRQGRDLGFAPLQLHWKKFCAGFFFGFCSLAFLAAMAILFGARALDFHQTAGAIALNLFAAILIALSVAILEETLFRGALFGALRKNGSWLRALTISSGIYALVHFFAKAEPPDSVGWLSGFVTLANMLRGFVDLPTLAPGFLNLFIAGAILALAFQRTGNLYFSIGLHAGWIFWLQSYRTFTDKVSGANVAWWGGNKMIDGWFATIMLGLTCIFALRIFQDTTPPPRVAPK